MYSLHCKYYVLLGNELILIIYSLFKTLPYYTEKHLKYKVDDLNPTDDREPSKEAHSSSYSGKFCPHVCLFIFYDSIKAGGGKTDLDQVEFLLLFEV